MSDALNFLVKARPEAMGHYLAFLKDCGTRLDPKTRNLISVITKVHAQTERGLRQYLKRALREGCSGEEILDALLMAFPALGLAKIVWAVDVILAMNLPEFAFAAAAQKAPEQAPAPGWHDLGVAEDTAPGATRRIERDGRAVFVHRGGDRWRVYDSHCPHEGTDMPLRALEGHTLTCERHRWRFDVRTGACTAEGDRPLREWDCRLQEGRLQAYW
jgi:nitrite reductase/ring-hydroxylating ferredoxin subunit/alkylhydroperoxidase/carboxymuconolactone decarboxylase family protein YurZ